jgi:hypothetical protein
VIVPLFDSSALDGEGSSIGFDPETVLRGLVKGLLPIGPRAAGLINAANSLTVFLFSYGLSTLTGGLFLGSSGRVVKGAAGGGVFSTGGAGGAA